MNLQGERAEAQQYHTAKTTAFNRDVNAIDHNDVSSAGDND